ncbi:U-box-domain-containing protein [Gonapodya prolifera JEL478]|uniref:E3 ubiquitin-protein ligase CHIP n=1 Tax=Gonapodya prolifera (strain JEL478) TaxID=1344416 RepID=A0A139AQH5_GONPJ|nr:U-box-domain-containing protein [Gonapodya prolifera JEL478]|eukprot:KXS19007.1 U-box-domain-containing protein [Gonapodya prolifera JEL478]
MSSAASSAESHKAAGNAAFARGEFETAIAEYTTAIIQNPTVSTYYTNRALCYKRLEQWDKVVIDCRKALELDEHAVKGHYFLGQALSESDTSLEEPVRTPSPQSSRAHVAPNFSIHTTAISHLRKAYDLSIKDAKPTTFTTEIGKALMKARRKKWELEERHRRSSSDQLHQYLTRLINEDRERRVGAILTATDELNSHHSTRQTDRDVDSAISDIHSRQDGYLVDLEHLFVRAEHAMQTSADLPAAGGQGKAAAREIPEYFTGKLRWELMLDPVVTHTGISYDRTEILDHLKRNGPFDPISRRPLQEKDLVPNLALREAIEDWLNRNGWSIEDSMLQ